MGDFSGAFLKWSKYYFMVFGGICLLIFLVLIRIWRWELTVLRVVPYTRSSNVAITSGIANIWSRSTGQKVSFIRSLSHIPKTGSIRSASFWGKNDKAGRGVISLKFPSSGTHGLPQIALEKPFHMHSESLLKKRPSLNNATPCRRQTAS